MTRIFEVRIVDVRKMPFGARQEIVNKIAGKPESFRRNYKGFAKVTYVTASPPKIVGVEPIEGTVIEYFESVKSEGGVDFSVF